MTSQIGSHRIFDTNCYYYYSASYYAQILFLKIQPHWVDFQFDIMVIWKWLAFLGHTVYCDWLDLLSCYSLDSAVTSSERLLINRQTFCQFFSWNLSALRSAARGNLVVPRTRLQLGNRAFCVAGPVVWNSLPLDIRSAPTLSTLRNMLKTHLFSRSYSLTNWFPEYEQQRL